MKNKTRSRTSRHSILETILLGLLLLISLPAIVNCFVVQSQMLDRLETPLFTSMTEDITSSSGTVVPYLQENSRAGMKEGDHGVPPQSLSGNPVE